MDGNDGRPLSRRSALRAIGATLVGAASVDVTTADESNATVSVTQGDRTVRLEPLSGESPIEAFYGYALPSRYEGDGVWEDAESPYNSSGTAALQRPATTITFLYDGPDGPCLVVVHGSYVESSPGGAASWAVEVDGSDPEWLVKDDLYRDADTGERPYSNYDEWDVEGASHEVHWTWNSNRTDGGALGYLEDGSTVTIAPRYNEAAKLYDRYYEGDVTDWEFLGGDRADPRRVSLALDRPVTVSLGGGSGQTPTPTETPTKRERIRAKREAIADEREEIQSVRREIRQARREESVEDRREAIAALRDEIDEHRQRIRELQADIIEIS